MGAITCLPSGNSSFIDYFSMVTHTFIDILCMFHGTNNIYPLVNKQFDPENNKFVMETNLPTPFSARVYVNLPEGNHYNRGYH